MTRPSLSDAEADVDAALRRLYETRHRVTFRALAVECGRSVSTTHATVGRLVAKGYATVGPVAGTIVPARYGAVRFVPLLAALRGGVVP